MVVFQRGNVTWVLLALGAVLTDHGLAQSHNSPKQQKLVSQGASVFWNKLAHLHSKLNCCRLLHDSTTENHQTSLSTTLAGAGAVS